MTLPWFFNPLPRAESMDSVCSHEEQEELVLHPNLSKVKSQANTKQDTTSILESAFGGSSKKFQHRESPAAIAALQQRAQWAAALKQQSKPHLVRDLLLKRRDRQKIFLLRHGESQANVSKYDVPDPNLTSVGTVQAKSWQESIGDFCAEVVLVSPLRRTVQTACFAFKYETIPLELCTCAREIGWGCGENTIHSDPASMKRMLSNLPRGPEVRGIEQALRVSPDDPIDELQSLERLKVTLASRPESTIVVVCHFGVINALTGARAKNGDVYECQWGADHELSVVARHKVPVEDEGCTCT